jgi:O-antigen ligase
MFSEQTHYIHNGFLFVILKAGYIGLALYMTMYFYVIRKCFTKAVSGSNEGAPARVALAVTLLATLMLNFAQPEFINGSTVLAMALLIPQVLRETFPIKKVS